MKRINIYSLLFFLALFLFPIRVFGTEYCKVVSGSGHDLGDEIACGEEHFYLLGAENNQLELFAKYNLYAGVEIHKEKLANGQQCYELANAKGGSVKDDGFYKAPEGYCFYSVRINTDRITQSAEAKSAHWDEDLNYLYPQVGDVYIGSNLFENNVEQLQNDSGFYDGDVILNAYESNSESSLYPTVTVSSLNRYKSQLVSDGYAIDSIGLLRLGRLDDILYQLSNKHMPLKEWGLNVDVTLRDPNNNSSILEAHFGDIKPFVPEEYKWLYSTTYWNSTYYQSSNNPTTTARLYVFVAEQGKLCGAGFAYCAPTTTLGCGLRPVLTMSSNYLKYAIYTPTDQNGEVEVIDSSVPGEPITFKVKAKEGYKLIELIIKTLSGQEIHFTENEIVRNSDGTISISDNTFTMPNESVTIQARWASIYSNPETLSSLAIIIVILVFVLGCSYSMYHMQTKKSK